MNMLLFKQDSLQCINNFNFGTKNAREVTKERDVFMCKLNLN